MYKSKMSHSIALAFLGLALASCADQPKEESTYANVAECTADGKSQQECQTALDEATKATAASAPKFQDEASCVAQFGIDGCRRDENGWFMPALMGFMVGNMMSGGNNHTTTHTREVVYRDQKDKDRDEGARTAGTAARPVYGAPGGGRQVATSTGGKLSFAKAAPTYAARVSARSSTTASRGGFGSRARGGSYGG